MKTFDVKIVSPNGIIFAGKSNSLMFPADDGLYGIMADHTPLISSLSVGNITVRLDESVNTFKVKNGTLICENNNVLITIQ